MRVRSQDLRSGEAKVGSALGAKATGKNIIPENLDNLDLTERRVREEAIKAIHADQAMMDHVELLEAVMDHIDFHAVRPSKDLDQETIQLLGARIFNDLASAYGQMTRGYYQISAMILRDVMEVVYLLGFFDRDPMKINEWREADEKTRKKLFKPVAVREFIDNYDGFKEGKRGTAYKMFCEYAAHPTWQGFQLLGPSGGGRRTIGAFFDAALMKAILEEMTLLAAQAGNNFASFFSKETDVAALETNLRRLEITTRWADRYLGLKRKPQELDDLKRMLAEVKRRP